MNSTTSADWIKSLPALRRWPYGLLLAAALLLVVLEVSIGSVTVPFRDTLRILFAGESGHETWTRIVLLLRVPRTINAAFSGAAIGVCGLLLQTLFRNPLADPFVLGVMNGGRLGVALVVVISGAASNSFIAKFGVLGDVSLVVASAVLSTAVLGFLLLVSTRVSTVTLLILGLMTGYLCEGLISVVLHFTDEFQAAAFESWNDGSYAGVTSSQLRLLVPLLTLGLGFAVVLAKPLNALLLGERYARSLGLPVARARMSCFGCIAVLAGTVTAFCGPIAFLGMVAAHLSKALFRTANHRVLIPGCMLMGAALALGADLITHLPWSKHFLHMNAVNGLTGAPIVIWVLLRRRGGQALEI
jgi:iron complex transport system permease protein